MALFPISFIFWRNKLHATKESLKIALVDLGFFTKGFKNDAKTTLKLIFTMFVASMIISVMLYTAGLNDLAKVDLVIAQFGIYSLLYLTIVRATAEEIFFRGFLVKQVGVIASTVFFAVLHLGYGSITEVIGALYLGFILAYVFSKNKSIFPNIFAHVFFNILSVFILPAILY